MNHKRGNSGELSIATCALNLAGNAARVFTTLVLTKVGIQHQRYITCIVSGWTNGPAHFYFELGINVSSLGTIKGGSTPLLQWVETSNVFTCGRIWRQLVVHALQDNLIMAGTALGVVLNSILLVQTLRTAHGDVQEEQGVLNPQPS